MRPREGHRRGLGQGALTLTLSLTLTLTLTLTLNYYYQINDDIRLSSRGWATELVGTLRANPYVPNLGVTGPLDTNNPRLSAVYEP